MDKISIIVPIYNTAEYLPGCFESLLAQRGVDFELILVDDGSQDNSAQICRDYEQRFPERIRFIAEKHGGVSVARNVGLNAATGDWIYFCDSDDLAEPDLCCYLLERAKQENADISSCALICDRSKERDIRTNYPGTGVEVWERDELLHRGALPFFRLNGVSHGVANSLLPTTLFRRDLIEQHHIRFIVGLALAEDEAFFLEYYIYAEKMALSNSVLYHYNAAPQSACASFFKRKCPFVRREKQWALLSRNRWRLYHDGVFEKTFPEIRDELRLTATYHEALLIESDTGLSFREKLQRFTKLITETRLDLRATKAPQNQLSGKFRCFRLLIDGGNMMLMIFCKMIRWMDALKQR